jgi:hypothetical protein
MTTQSQAWPTANQDEVEQVEAAISQRKLDSLERSLLSVKK